MADLLAPFAPVDLVPEGHHGRPGGAGVTLGRVADMAAATLIARRNAGPGLIAAAAAAGWILADAPRLSPGPGLDGVGLGPGRWLVTAERTAPADLIARLQAIAGDAGTACDQSDGLLVFDIAGPEAGAALAKGLGIDLHPRAFQAGDAASTLVAQVALSFWQMPGDGGPRYRFAVPRSFAPAFTRWLAASAAQFGLTVSGAMRG